MHKRSPVRCRFLFKQFLIVASCGLNAACGQDIEIARSGLVYVIGRVNHVVNEAAQIDLGDVHTLRPGEKVALIRPQEDYHVPVGVVEIAETYPTFCRAAKSTGVQPELGDIVIFVREFSQLKPAAQHRDHFVKHRFVKNAGNNQYSTFGQADIAIALADYKAQYDKWERSKRDVLGFMSGKSFARGKEETIKPLLSQINMMRESLREGRNSLPAAGEGWVSVMSVIAGPTVMAQHQASRKVVTEDEFIDEEESGPLIRDIQRQVNETLFDRHDEERKLITYLVANIIEVNPRRLELWFAHNVRNSQFPELADEVALVDQIRRILQKLRGESI